MLLLISCHPDLVTANDRFQTVLLTESLGNVRSELHADTALAGTAAGLRLGICPEHFHHEAGLARLALLVSVELPDVVQGNIVIRKQTAMEHKVLLTD